MWKSCEVEICPWHEKRSKRKEFHANRKSKKKVYRMDNESGNDREKSEDTNIQTNLSCHSYESDNCNKVSSVDVEKDFTDLEALQVHPESPEKDQNIKGSGGGEKVGKKFWSAPLKAHKYVVEYPPKTLQWSSNMQQKYRRN